MNADISLNAVTASPEENRESPRLIAVDIAKGILILAVVFSHAWFANADILGDVFPYAMSAFFFLSGYTYRPGRKYLRNIGKRAVHLLLPYIFFGVACNLLYPVYLCLSHTMPVAGTETALWTASLKADALNMLMGTPMWFLAAMFTASILFFAVVDKTRESLPKTAAASALLIAVAIVIDIVKKENIPWYADYAPFAVAIMLIGAYCGGRKLFLKLNLKNIAVAVVCFAVCAVFNSFFPGSGKTSVVQYIEGGQWYGVLTAFVIAVTGSIGILYAAGIVGLIPGVRRVFVWLGKNSIWILCIHYVVIMLIELKLFNMKVLSNSIMQVVAVSIYGFGSVKDNLQDIIVKSVVAVLSIGVSGVYAVIHNLVKNNIKKLKSKRK